MNTFIRRIKEDKHFKESILSQLFRQIDDKTKLIEDVNYVIENKLDRIEKDITPIYNDEDDDMIFLIFSSFIRIWTKVYINTPDIFTMPKSVTSVKGYIQDRRLELFQLNFNIDEFFDYMYEMLKKCQNLLSEFKYLDKTQETLNLIIDNYIAKMISNVTRSDDINSDIRDLKIRGIL